MQENQAELTNQTEQPDYVDWTKTSEPYVKTPTVFQMEVSECGAASLAMILQYYGKYVPLDELRIETGVSRDGCNAKNICLAAEKYGLAAAGHKRELDKMVQKAVLPCIIHWNFSHFVVFEGVKHGKYIINDPAQGRRKISREDMEGSFTGVLLDFKPTVRFHKSARPRTLRQFAVNRLAGQYRTLLALLLIGICLIAPGVLIPVFSQVFLDEILLKGMRSWMKWLLLFMLLTMLFQAYFGFIRSRLTLLLKSKMSVISSDSMLGHMFRLPMIFFEQRFAGDLVQRIDNNMAVSDFLSEKLVGIVINVLTSLVYMIIMCFYNPLMALVGVGFSALTVLAISLSTKKIATMTLKYGQDFGKMIGYVLSGINVSNSLKAVGAENEYTSRVLGYYATVTTMDQKLGRIQQSLDVIPQAMQSINNILILIIGSRLVVDGKLTAGMVVAFMGFLSSFLNPFGDIISFARDIQQVKNDMGRVEDIMRTKEDDSYHMDKNESMGGRKLRGEIELSDLSFAYGKLDKPFIKNFNFHIKSGQSIALVGSSGCGKSTVAKLLSSLYQPWGGEILFDGVACSEIPEEVIAASVSVVTQSIALFDGSIYDNITMWNSTIRHEDVVKAAKDACIHDDITRKAAAYDYQVCEGGSNLSGGQRQRIEIAKALATNPTILIMDEATSSLDAATEKKILDNIKRRHCTCIVVAQRLSTIRDCDEIIVMERGRIVERGSHESLMALGGKYSRLIASN